MWAFDKVFYHLNALEICKAMTGHDEVDQLPEHSILRLTDYILHLKRMNVGVVCFSPVYQLSSDGVYTKNFNMIDRRLGDEQDFKTLCDAFHKNGFRVVMETNFSHVGREFEPFQEFCRHREQSMFANWFENVDFEGYGPVDLNLNNQNVTDFLLEVVESWMDDFGIDGVKINEIDRMGVNFVRELRVLTNHINKNFFMIGTMESSDYGRNMAKDKFNSIANGALYNRIYSAFNSKNMFEPDHLLVRQFADEPWTAYRGMHLLSYVDGPFLPRAAARLKKPEHLRLLFGYLLAVPGIPCIYYGDEWCVKTDNINEDNEAGRKLSELCQNDFASYLSNLIRVRNTFKSLRYGDFRSMFVSNSQCVFARKIATERVIVAINADDKPYTLRMSMGCRFATELVSGNLVEFTDTIILPELSVQYFKDDGSYGF